MENGVDAMETYLAVPKMFSIELPYDPAIVLRGIYPRELKHYAHAKTVIFSCYAQQFLSI